MRFVPTRQGGSGGNIEVSLLSRAGGGCVRVYVCVTVKHRLVRGGQQCCGFS